MPDAQEITEYRLCLWVQSEMVLRPTALLCCRGLLDDAAGLGVTYHL